MQKQYSVLFADADNTLFDFDRAERVAFTRTMDSFGIPCDDALFFAYNAINAALWQALERGETTQARLRVDRFSQLLEKAQLPGDAQRMNAVYSEHLGACDFLLPDALAAMQRWSARVPIYIVTNGIAQIQRARLALSPVAKFVRDIIISEEVGAAKPDGRMFDAAHARAGSPPRSTVLMLGDSLMSDILGANRAGIDSCWFNPHEKKNTSPAVPTYEIHNLGDVDALLR